MNNEKIPTLIVKHSNENGQSVSDNLVALVAKNGEKITIER